MTLSACTIVARNYLPHARVLARSFLEHDPGSTFTTLIIDDRGHEAGDNEPFQVIHLDELIADPLELHMLATYYDVMELATAVKPVLLLHLLKQTSEPVVYLDPDIQVFASLDVVEKAAREEPIVLTPHTLVPYPRDGLRPTEAEILGAGVYNLGFIAVAHGAEVFLRWWWERLQRDAVVDPSRMLFTDQRWIDFVPGLFPHLLLKDPGLNVAYWNLHGRSIERRGDGFAVNDVPLRFFHFSGYSPFDRDTLSKHTGDHPRVRLQDSAVLMELAHAYGDKLLAEGLVNSGGPPYGWGVADGGFRLDAPARRAYREAVLEGDKRGGLRALPDPFVAGGGAALTSWLGTPAPGGPWRGISRYLQAVYDMRPDLQRAFPAGSKGSEQRFLDWAKDGSFAPDRAPGELAALLGGSGTAASRRSADAPELPAVHAVGYFRAELGMGEYGRQLVEAVRQAGAAVSTTTWTETLSRQQHEFADEPATTDAGVNLLVVNADQTPVFAAAAGEGFFAERHTVGAWAWEIDEFPRAYDEAFMWVDEVWAISSFTRDAIARCTDIPVFAVPPPVSAPMVEAAITREQLGLPPGYVFLFLFDFLSVAKRKNPLGLVHAFSGAFAEGEGPTLVIKSINGDKQRAAQQQLRDAAAARSDVILIEEYLASAEVTALMALADCYVSLHRSEGFGLTIAQAMALGKPVIGTAYSGNLDFMTEDTSFLVPYDLVPVGSDAEPYPAAASWAEPRLDVASRLLRQVWEDPTGAAAVGAHAAEHIAQNHSPQARAALVSERLADILARRPELEHSGPPTTAGGTLALGPVQRRVRRAKFLLHVARTPEMRRAAIRRRAGRLVNAGFAESRRAGAQQEATQRELVTLRSRLDLVSRDVDTLGARLAAAAPIAAAQADAISELRPLAAEVASMRRSIEGVSSMRQLIEGVSSMRQNVEGRLDFLERRLADINTGSPADVPEVPTRQAASESSEQSSAAAADGSPGVAIEVRGPE